jgi:hypothetical protein
MPDTDTKEDRKEPGIRKKLWITSFVLISVKRCDAKFGTSGLTTATILRNNSGFVRA